MQEPSSEPEFAQQANEVRKLAARIDDGVRRDAIERVAVFGLARIPLLVQLGAALDDKLDTRVFQRHRRDGGNAWTWPTDETIASFDTEVIQQGTDRQSVALILSISGSIERADLPSQLDGAFTIYEVRPATVEQGPSVISSAGDLAVLEAELRRLLAAIEEAHGKVEKIEVFPAIGVATAVTLGRVLMPQVSPALVMYERDDQRSFFRALEVRR